MPFDVPGADSSFPCAAEHTLRARQHLFVLPFVALACLTVGCGSSSDSSPTNNATAGDGSSGAAISDGGKSSSSGGASNGTSGGANGGSGNGVSGGPGNGTKATGHVKLNLKVK